MNKSTLTEKQKKTIAAAGVVIFILLSLFLFWFVGRPMIRFAKKPELFRQWVDQRGIWGKAAFVGMVFLQVLVAIIPGEPLELCGGYAFGAFWGTALCLIGAVLGSVAVFAFVRKFGQPLVEVFFPKEKLESLRFLRSSPKRDALFWLIFTVPGTPKDLLCYFAGLTDLSWGKWLLMATVGRIPSILTSTIGGDAMGVQNYQFAIITFAVTLVISGIGLLIYRAICRRHETAKEKEKAE
ncbi:MAG: TVP38/TMEM64 family protein [Oscillospiraceae bacterium]|nr:TVP38/TMEM64 family protein [Oscillospiraceae bacterium]